MERLSTGFRDSKGEVIYNDHLMMTSTGVPFQIVWFGEEWMIFDECGDIAGTLEEIVKEDEVRIVGIPKYN